MGGSWRGEAVTDEGYWLHMTEPFSETGRSPEGGKAVGVQFREMPVSPKIYIDEKAPAGSRQALRLLK